MFSLGVLKMLASGVLVARAAFNNASSSEFVELLLFSSLLTLSLKVSESSVIGSVEWSDPL